MKLLSQSIVLLFLLSCTERSANNQEAAHAAYVINEAEIVNQFDLKYSEYLKSMRFIPLETAKGSIIMKMSGVLLFEEHIIISDLSNGRLLVFDEEGSFVRQLGNTGHGSGEYRHVHCFKASESSKEIHALDKVLKKILVFDLDGQVLREIKLNFTDRIGDSFALLDDGSYLFPLQAEVGQRSAAYIQVSKNGQVQETYLDGKGINYHFTTSFGKKEVNDFGLGLTLVPRYSNVIYRFAQNHEPAPYITINPKAGYDEQGVEELYRRQSGLMSSYADPSSYRLASNYQGMWDLGEYIETNKFITFAYRESPQKRLISLYVNKETGEQSRSYWKDDTPAQQYTGNKFIKVQPPYLIKWGPKFLLAEPNQDPSEVVSDFKSTMLNNPYFERESDIVKSRIRNFDIGSNPVIVLCELKDEYM